MSNLKLHNMAANLCIMCSKYCRKLTNHTEDFSWCQKDSLCRIIGQTVPA